MSVMTPADGWSPVQDVLIQVEKGARRATGAAAWDQGRIRLKLPGGLTKREEARLLGLLIWGLLGRVMAPTADRLARRLNEAHFRRPLQRVCFHHQTRRWGSCSSGRCIYLSHRLLAARAELVETVLLHELAHLDCLNHGREFWRALEQADPGCRRGRSLLAAYGRVWEEWWLGHLRHLARHGWTRLDPPAFEAGLCEP